MEVEDVPVSKTIVSMKVTTIFIQFIFGTRYPSAKLSNMSTLGAISFR